MAFCRIRTHSFMAFAKTKLSPFELPSSFPTQIQSSSSIRPILHCRPFARPAMPHARLPLPIGDKLIEMIRGLSDDQIRLDQVSSPKSCWIPAPELKNMLRITQMEAVRSRLKQIPQVSIVYSDFIRICSEESSTEESAADIAQSLDDSGSVIVLGNLVFLRPAEVLREIERAIPLPIANEQIMKELRDMESRKAEIDKTAATSARRELWCGLGFLLAQTLGFMRLTFWELSWDVMEPVCFYVTSTYFMAGYSFFLRTAREPSFEGFFECRFASKQKRLMKDFNFDLTRFQELKKQASLLPRKADSDDLFCRSGLKALLQ